MSLQKSRRAKMQSIYQLRIELLRIEPTVWRRILVPGALPLSTLDRIVQAAMGWTNTHFHAWRIDGRHYTIPDPEVDTPGEQLDERQFTVGGVLGGNIDELCYEYDFGDGWEHRIVVEKRLSADPQRNTWPMCTAGANACPPEDVGGPSGYMHFVQVMRDPMHEDHVEIWGWHGGPFDPTGFSINDANRAIGKVNESY